MEDKTTPVDEILKKYHLTKENYSDRGGSYFTVENIKAALKEYAAQSAPKQSAGVISKKEVADLLHTILNYQQEIYTHSSALRTEVVTIKDIKAAFEEYFDIKEPETKF